MGGGGASELKERLGAGNVSLATAGSARLGGAVRIGEEEIFVFTSTRASSSRIPSTQFRSYLIAESVRDWFQLASEVVWYPYHDGDCAADLATFWPWRTSLANRATFQGVMADAGRSWYEYMQFTPFPYTCPLTVSFAEIATHNHFVLDRGGKVFKQTAPVVKLPESVGEAEHISLLGILNSSTIGFGLRKMCYDKGSGGNGRGISTESWEHMHAFDSTKVGQLPLPTGRPTELATAIQSAADKRTAFAPVNLVKHITISAKNLAEARGCASALLRRMISLQEELDWDVYNLYGLTVESITPPIDQIPEIDLGQRAFEIAMARQLAEGEIETEWFNRHGSVPITEIPAHWPEPYRQLVQRRMDKIAGDRDIALVEKLEYKRRWNFPKEWHDLENEALRNWLLDRLEDPQYWPQDPPMLRTVSNLASAMAEDPEFIQVAEIYVGRSDFKLETLVAELIEKQSIPFLPILRYKRLGITKRKQWEETWDLQRREDAGEKLSVDVPPKYEKTDFLTDTVWRLRGKLDVPKERWVSYSYLNRISDATLVVGWAGYDHAQQAFALAAYYQSVKEDGLAPSRLVPALAGILDLLPWVKQWHNAPDTSTGAQAGDFLEEFLRNEVSNLNFTEGDLRNWTSPETQKRPPASRRSVKEKRS